MLILISQKYNKKDFRLYGDDRLTLAKHKSRQGTATTTTKKNKEKHTKKILTKLDIIIQCNMKIVNCLEVSLNLNNWNYEHSTNLITKYYKSIKNQITHLVSLNKSPHRLEN